MDRACVLEPELMLHGAAVAGGTPIGVDAAGRFCPAETVPSEAPRLKLPGRLLLPGLVNAHSHAVQRLIRGRAEFLAEGRGQDDFWSWRERMYQVANALDPEDVYVASRQAFVEMALAGITTVGEFHYLHHAPDGSPYANRNELSLQVIRAARDVGLRVVLLKVAYARAGFGLPESPAQRRFCERDVESFLSDVESLRRESSPDPAVSVGLAPHSVRAVPREWLEELARVPDLPIHMHVAEQPKEVEACLAEHGRRPIELLDGAGMLSRRFTAVHGIELGVGEIEALGRARAAVCACPSTERNLGDGVVEADRLKVWGVRLCLGSDSQAEIDLLSEARQLEAHLRLLRRRRAVLDEGHRGPEGLAATLLGHATAGGAQSLAVEAGGLSAGLWADAFTVDLSHPSLVGLSQRAALAQVIFGASPGAVRDVFVAGRRVVVDGHHPLEAESARRFAALAARVLG